MLVPLAAGAGALGVCCGLPLLASLGVSGMVAGLGGGSWIAVTAASSAAVIGVLRWRAQRCCDSPSEAEQADPAVLTAVSSVAPHREAGR
jgi:hypothetical protein